MTAQPLSGEGNGEHGTEGGGEHGEHDGEHNEHNSEGADGGEHNEHGDEHGTGGGGEHVEHGEHDSEGGDGGEHGGDGGEHGGDGGEHNEHDGEGGEHNEHDGEGGEHDSHGTEGDGEHDGEHGTEGDGEHGSERQGEGGRVLVAKVGLDGHDRGVKVVGRILRDAGFEVIYTGLQQTPAMVVAAARDEDVDVIGLSLLSGAHMTLVPRILDGLRDEGLDIPVVVGGIIPVADAAALTSLGVAAVLTPGASSTTIIEAVTRAIEDRAHSA